MPGRLYRSHEPRTSFEEKPLLFNTDKRRSALLKRGEGKIIVKKG